MISEADGARGRKPMWSASGEPSAIQTQDATPGENQCAFDKILQLPHVTGPVIALELIKLRSADLGLGDSKFPRGCGVQGFRGDQVSESWRRSAVDHHIDPEKPDLAP